jgi:hypothetical protein
MSVYAMYHFIVYVLAPTPYPDIIHDFFSYARR